MDIRTKPSNLTASQKAALHGPWVQGRRMNKFALAWKLMEDLVLEEFGMNEVEAYEWKKKI